MADEIRADKARAAGDQKFQNRLLF